MIDEEWKPPRRNGHYICIGRVTLSMGEWARRCGIERHTLFQMQARHGKPYMVRRIKQGMKGEYDPTWWHKRAGKVVTRSGAPDNRFLVKAE